MADAAAPPSTSPRALIARRSLTPDDAGCQELLAARLAPLGFRCETLVVNGVTNLWARRGTARPLVCFAGHTDVVPTGPLDRVGDRSVRADDARRLPLRPRRGGHEELARRLRHGDRGVRRTRMPHAAGLDRAARSPPTRKARRSTARRAWSSGCAARGERIDYCVVGEPSSVERLGDMIKNGRRGTLSGTLIVHGVQGHIAYPHLARNPIHLRRARARRARARRAGTTATSTSRRRPGSARTSTRAPVRATSSPARSR